MKVKASQQVEVDLDQLTINKITLDNIQRQITKTGYDWKVNDYYIDDGKVLVTDIFHGGHSWRATREIREATRLDEFYDSFIRWLEAAMSSNERHLSSFKFNS